MFRVLVAGKNIATIEVEENLTIHIENQETGEKCTAEVIAVERTHETTTLLITACNRTIRVTL